MESEKLDFYFEDRQRGRSQTVETNRIVDVALRATRRHVCLGAFAPRFAERSGYSELIFAEEQVLDSTENFFDANGRGKKTVAAENAAGDHLTLRFEAA